MDTDLVPGIAAPRPLVRSTVEWLAYFRANAATRLPVPWERGAGVTPEELAEIAGSLRGWQLGETSDGRHLLRTAQRYADRIGDPDFVDVIRLFIAEEQRHGADLGRFLDLAGVPRASWDWGDRLFRAVRYLLPRMEVWATPVAMVETHAMVYYAALGKATRSPVLRAICQQILLDEVPHIRFQCERLAALHQARSRPLYDLTMSCHRLFFTVMTLLIWLGHARALRAGGLNFRRFWRSSWARMDVAWRLMNPRAYRWPATEHHASLAAGLSTGS